MLHTNYVGILSNRTYCRHGNCKVYIEQSEGTRDASVNEEEGRGYRKWKRNPKRKNLTDEDRM